VFVVKPDNSVEMRPVVVARTDEGEAVISKGLQAGEQIVREGQFLLGPGSRIEIKNAQTKTEETKKSRAAKGKGKVKEGGES
jgi:multidrug efflux system membrane fusion protein